MSSEIPRKVSDPSSGEEDSLSSAVSNMAGWFIKENLERGIPLKIPSLGIQINPDGSVKDLENPSEPSNGNSNSQK